MRRELLETTWDVIRRRIESLARRKGTRDITGSYLVIANGFGRSSPRAGAHATSAKASGGRSGWPSRPNRHRTASSAREDGAAAAPRALPDRDEAASPLSLATSRGSRRSSGSTTCDRERAGSSADEGKASSQARELERMTRARRSTGSGGARDGPDADLRVRRRTESCYPHCVGTRRPAIAFVVASAAFAACADLGGLSGASPANDGAVPDATGGVGSGTSPADCPVRGAEWSAFEGIESRAPAGTLAKLADGVLPRPGGQGEIPTGVRPSVTLTRSGPRGFYVQIEKSASSRSSRARTTSARTASPAPNWRLPTRSAARSGRRPAPHRDA